MSNATATIRELRLNFRSIKRKLEEYGSVVISDNGTARYQITPLPQPVPPSTELPDYHARLQKQQRLSTQATRDLHEENRC